MSFAIIIEQQSSGVSGNGGAAVVAGNNQRVLNYIDYNDIGVTLGTGASANTFSVVVDGDYFVEVHTPSFQSQTCRAILWDFVTGMPLKTGLSQSSGPVGGPASAAINADCQLLGVVNLTTSMQIGVMQYHGSPGSLTFSPTGFGFPVSDGNTEIYTSVVVTLI